MSLNKAILSEIGYFSFSLHFYSSFHEKENTKFKPGEVYNVRQTS